MITLEKISQVKNKTIIGNRAILQWQKELCAGYWPVFMQHISIISENWKRLYTYFLDYQIALFENNNLLGIGNSIPLNWQRPFNELPSEGLTWAFEKAIDDFQNNIRPNLLVPIQILFNPAHTHQGISYELWNIMKHLASSKGIKNIATPLRPTLKQAYPNISMEEYINWKNNDGRHFDPWISVNVKAGGKIIGICDKSLNIIGTVPEWEEWTKMKFNRSGQYIVDKALIPIDIDIEKNIGQYLEPNLWMLHAAEKPSPPSEW